MNGDPVISVKDLVKDYRMGSVIVHALHGVSFDITAGEMVAIMGQSGSGKSTLMNILGCLDVPTSGRYVLDGAAIGELDDDALAAIRNRKIGFVFQSFNLLPRLSAMEQVEVPLIYAGRPGRRSLAEEALSQVRLSERRHHRPTELSGGEQQRVAIARALVMQPRIILADEPTGNLDSATAEGIMDLLDQLNRDSGITTVLITHEADIARRTRRVIRLRDGQVEADLPVAEALAR